MSRQKKCNKPKAATPEIRQRIQKLLDTKGDSSVELKDFVYPREGWTEKLKLKQPSLDGIIYDLAVCTLCRAVFDAVQNKLFAHHKASEKPKGDCVTRRNEGRTLAESKGMAVTPEIRKELQEKLKDPDDESIQRRKFVGLREEWTTKYSFYQPILNGVPYEIAFCEYCKGLIEAKEPAVRSHWVGRMAPKGSICKEGKQILLKSKPEDEEQEDLQEEKSDAPAKSPRTRAKKGKKATLEIRQLIQNAVDDPRDTTVELTDFFKPLKGSVEKPRYYQPTLEGITYDLAVCTLCRAVLDATKQKLQSHWKLRDTSKGDCETRQKEGRTVEESKGAEVTAEIRKELQKKLDDPDDTSIRSRKFVGEREEWTTKYNFYQPILDGVAYEIAFCSLCNLLFDPKSYHLGGHWKSRDTAKGACQTRRRGGKTYRESERFKATARIRQQIQELLDTPGDTSIGQKEFDSTRRGWNEKGFYQPVFEGYAYELAVCSRCNRVFDTADPNTLNNHWNQAKTYVNSACKRRQENPKKFVHWNQRFLIRKKIGVLTACDYCDDRFDVTEVVEHRVVCRWKVPKWRTTGENANIPVTEAELAYYKAKQEEALAEYLRDKDLDTPKKWKANLNRPDDTGDEDTDKKDLVLALDPEPKEDEEGEEEEEEDMEPLAESLKQDYQRFFRCGSKKKMPEKPRQCPRCKQWFPIEHYGLLHREECIVKLQDVQIFEDQSVAPEDHPKNLYFPRFQLKTKDGFKCQWPKCSKVYVDIWTIKRHWMYHTGEKPFDCSVCGESFISSGEAEWCELSHSSMPKSEVEKLVASKDARVFLGVASKQRNSIRFEHFEQIFIDKKKTIFQLCKICKSVLKYTSTNKHYRSIHA